MTVLEVPQWQGSSSATAFRLRDGAGLLADLVPGGRRVRVEVGDPPAGTPARARAALAGTAARTRAALDEARGGFTVTVGGDCGVELEPIAAAVRRHGDRLAVVWFDAHGDLNTPESSPSGAFHGMVLRTLLGEGPADLVPDRPLRPGQVVLAGARAFDDAERAYIAETGIRTVAGDGRAYAAETGIGADASSERPHATESANRTDASSEHAYAAEAAIRTDIGALLDALDGAGAVYVHVDLDVLDPEVFRSVGSPAPGGLSPRQVEAMITALAGRFEIAGLGVTEYEPVRARDQETLAGLVPTIVEACRASAVDQVERRAIAAWPAGVVEARDGWLLRHTPDVRRRRSNSAVPPAEVPGVEAIERMEAFYRERGRPVLVQVGPSDRHAELDEVLAARGYRREAPTALLTAFTDDVIAATGGEEADLEESPDGWVKIFAELDEHADSAMVGERVISRIAAPRAFVSVMRDGRPAGMGLFVADSGWAGVFSMATRPERRGEGIGAAVLGTGARWAARVGAHRMYLQVEVDNENAHRLYTRAGFTWSHGYHYRVGEGSATPDTTHR